MIQEQRQSQILSRITEEKHVSAQDLADWLQVSEDTIRRDLITLSERGECRRVRGGASALLHAAEPIEVRSSKDLAAKHRLATAAARLISPNSTVFLDAGSTNQFIARALPEDCNLVVATNSPDIASDLRLKQGCRVFLAGGEMSPTSGACFGEDTLAAVRNLRMDTVFLGACGIDEATGVTAYENGEASVKRALVAGSKQIIIAATNEKLNKSAPFHIADIEQIDHLILEKSSCSKIRLRLALKDIEIHLH